MHNEEKLALQRNKLHHVKFILAVFVILIHTFNLAYYGKDQKDYLYFVEMFFSERLGRIAVPLFFFISGLLFFLNMDCLADVFTKLKKRAKSVVIPYLLWNLLYTVLFLVVFKLPVLRSLINSDGELSLHNILGGVFLYQYSYHFWYLAHLICFFALTPLLTILLKNRKLSLVILVLLAGVNVMGFSYGEIRFGDFFYFYCGAFLAKWHPQPVIYVQKKKTVSAIALVVLIVMNAVMVAVENPYAYRVSVLFSMVCFWIAMDLFAETKVYAFEKESFFIYCIHTVILEAVEKLIGRLGISRGLGLVDYILAPIICLVLTYMIFRLMKKFTPKVYGVLTGGRV